MVKQIKALKNGIGILLLLTQVQCWGQQAQSLKKKKFQVCGVPLSLELAQTAEEQRVGLMYRTEVPSGTGMIFIFPEEKPLSFWMNNVPMDIDIGYFTKTGELINFHTMKGTSPLQKPETLPQYPSFSKARFAVEVESGFYEKHKANPGACRLTPVPH